MIRKGAMICLAGILAATALSGCGNTASNPSGKGAEPSTNVSTQGQKAETKAETKPVLKALMPYMGSDYNTYPSAAVLEERTGYKVQYDMLPQDKPDDKLNLIIASGEKYDFIKFYNKDRYLDYAQQGALVELEGLIDQYGPNIKDNIAGESFDGLRVNGKYYAIPTTAVTATGKATVSNLLAVREDWLDALGLDLPTTIDEFTYMLEQIKVKDPGGNGDKNIPLVTGANPSIDWLGIGGAFGFTHEWNDVSGELVPKVLMPGYKEYVAYLHELYTKKLLDQEFPTNQGATVREKFTSGRAGVMAMAWHEVPAVMDAISQNAPGAKIAFIQPLAGIEKAAISIPVITHLYDGLTVIPKASDHPEEVIRYLSAKLEEETFIEFIIGEKDVHYTVEDGRYYPITPKFFDERGNSNMFLTGASKNYGTYWLARLRKDDRLYEAYNIINVDYGSFQIESPVGTAPPMPEIAQNSQVLSQLTEDFIVKSVVGSIALSAYDDFVKDWKSNGGEESTKVINEWYKTIRK